MATDVKKIKFVYFVHMHPKAFHLTGYKQNLFLTFASYIEKLPEIAFNFFKLQCSDIKTSFVVRHFKS